MAETDHPALGVTQDSCETVVVVLGRHGTVGERNFLEHRPVLTKLTQQDGVLLATEADHRRHVQQLTAGENFTPVSALGRQRAPDAGLAVVGRADRDVPVAPDDIVLGVLGPDLVPAATAVIQTDAVDIHRRETVRVVHGQRLNVQNRFAPIRSRGVAETAGDDGPVAVPQRPCDPARADVDDVQLLECRGSREHRQVFDDGADDHDMVWRRPEHAARRAIADVDRDQHLAGTGLGDHGVAVRAAPDIGEGRSLRRYGDGLDSRQRCIGLDRRRLRLHGRYAAERGGHRHRHSDAGTTNQHEGPRLEKMRA